MPPALQFHSIAPSESPGSVTVYTSSAPATMDDIRSLVDVGAMTQLLHETIARERDIDSELEQILSQKLDLEHKILSLHKAAEVVELVRSDADHMADSVRSTCHLAEHVSGKVRELDIAQSRVQDTIGRIDAMVDRSSCIDGVQAAMDSQDYEAAANYVSTFLQLDREFADLSLDSGLDQKRQLLESKATLEEVIRRKFAEASENRDQANVERFAKIFAPLGLRDEGLTAYVAYLRKVIGSRARQEFESLCESLDPGSDVGNGFSAIDFVDSLTTVLRDVAMAVESNEESLIAIHSREGIVFCIRQLEDEVNIRGTAIVNKYVEARKLARLAKEASDTGGSVGVTPAPDPREVEILLEEMLMISKRSQDFAGFMDRKLADALGDSLGDGLLPGVTEGSEFRVGAFSRSIQEMMAHYVVLEEYFMAENVRKAIKIDEFVAEQLTTSMVDDVFYIVQNSARRAISTSNVQPLLAALNNINNVLNNEYREALLGKIREPNLAARLFSVAGGTVAKTGAEVATALNNAEVSAEYVLKLRQDIDTNCQEVFPAPAEREKVKSCLNDLTETSNSLKQLAAVGLEELAKSITPRLRVTLDSLSTVSYDLTEQQYAENELNDPWLLKFMSAVESSVTWLQPLLTPNNYDSLVHLIIDFIVKRLEVVVSQKKFNQLGGLQLDRDCRTLLVQFSGMTSRTVRDKFARLTQMAQILNLEKVSEILDYWGDNSGPTTWRLSPAEVRKVLGLRVDFKPDAIASLRL